MAALLLADAAVDEELFAASLHRFVALAEALVAGHSTYIASYTPQMIMNYDK